MIRETLAALGLASRRALASISQQRSWKPQIAHVREWSFAMPHLSRIVVANSPVHQIYVGLSQNLARFLGESPAARERAHEQLLEALKVNLVASLPARRPIVTWERLEPSPEPRVLRGVRSFILRQHGAPGNLYLMADLASRCEYETLRDPDWLEEVSRELLPGDLGRIDAIENPRLLDRLSTFVARCEQDLELLIPGPDGEVHAVNGVVLGRSHRDDVLSLRLSLDLDRKLGVDLSAGREFEGAFGAAGRVFRFRTPSLGEEPLALEGLGALSCLGLEFPRRIHLDQRRRYFRIEPEGDLTARLESVDTGAAAAATVADLSFSGAGLVLTGTLAGLAPGASVRLAIDGCGTDDTVVIAGIVRRVQTVPRGKGRHATLVGVEFMVDGPGDRQATQQIRQYVMACQRTLLALNNR
jgi:c-di-GMP-binding flagellar brake protein YcgR